MRKEIKYQYLVNFICVYEIIIIHNLRVIEPKHMFRSLEINKVI